MAGLVLLVHTAAAQNAPGSKSATLPTLEDVRTAGISRSRYRMQTSRGENKKPPTANLKAFREEVEPLLRKACVRCHGPRTQKRDFRIDSLDPDLLRGDDVDSWLEVLAVVTKGEMPPPKAPLSAQDRRRIVEWLSSEIRIASSARRAEGKHSSFRRMTRYEYNYALQDLPGLPHNFAKDLPPEPISEDGFQNSSELLHMSSLQFQAYRELGRNALLQATVHGNRPAELYWGASMEVAAEAEWKRQD